MRHLKTLGVVISMALFGQMVFAGGPANSAVVSMASQAASTQVSASSSCMEKNESLGWRCVVPRVLEVVSARWGAASDDGAANEVVVCEAESVKSLLNPMNMSE